jgi:SAM-dependent methyltransferase
MTPDEQWISAVWPFVCTQLPDPPATVVELGCGPLGGFVPRLRAAGYQATGVDPEAPEGPEYERTEFERYEMAGAADAIVACTSLHHVADLGDVLDRIGRSLAPGGAVVVVEWARELFDEATARWCFRRLPAGEEHNWLRHRQQEWLASGQPWDAFREVWAAAEKMHSGDDVLRALERRFGSGDVTYGPYFFSDLAIGEADEQAAIDAGEIRATRISYAGRVPG